MIFVERKCWVLTSKVGYTFLQDTLYGVDVLNILSKTRKKHLGLG